MTRSQMFSSVGQTILLIACRLIISHHLDAAASEKFNTLEVFKNYTQAVEFAANSSKALNSTTPKLLTLPSGLNETAINSTLASTPISNAKESFYWPVLPRELFANFIIAILEYYWQIWLERALPARPRPSQKLIIEKFSKGDDESREEEVVKKWIAQGRVRRASLSWCNTFFKWILDVVLGGLWMTSVFYLVDGLLKFDSSPKVLVKGLKSKVLFMWAMSLFCSQTVASLIAFIIVPAHKRIVFVAGIDLAFGTFVGLFMNLIIPWAANTEFVRTAFGNMTEVMEKGPRHGRPMNEL